MSNPRVVVIVQARMGSTRLPGKVLASIRGEPMIVRQLERLLRCRHVDVLVVATTDLAGDDPVVDAVGRLPGVGVFRGSEEDVLARYVGAARATGAEVIVRITADCPLIEPTVVDRCVLTMHENPDAEYVSNVHRRTYPRGLDTEVVRAEALETAYTEATHPFEREHVTPFIWRRPERFVMVDVTAADDHSHLRWTVDTPQDLGLIERVYEALHPTEPDFCYERVLRLFREHPELARINADVVQKPVAG